jgi:hypothetical protein
MPRVATIFSIEKSEEAHQLFSPDSKPLKRFGERGRNRTFNLLIKSQLLCQLSYAPLLWNRSDEDIKRSSVSVTQALLQVAAHAFTQAHPSILAKALREERHLSARPLSAFCLLLTLFRESFLRSLAWMKFSAGIHDPDKQNCQGFMNNKDL